MFCVPLGELETHLEQPALHGLVEGDLGAVHGVGDEPHRQVIVVGEREEEEVKPKVRWKSFTQVFVMESVYTLYIPSILKLLYSDKIINYSKFFLESKVHSCEAFVKNMTWIITIDLTVCIGIQHNANLWDKGLPSFFFSFSMAVSLIHQYPHLIHCQNQHFLASPDQFSG